MITPIPGTPLQGLNAAGGASPAKIPGQGQHSFADTLKESITKVDDMQHAADQSVTDLAVGRTKTLHETMISVEQADISFKMLMAVRGKVINAYQEIMRMQF
jgi:flagellar hook-basal body complex protein FliE